MLLHLDKARYVDLQGVGAAIWNDLDEPRLIADICDDLAARFLTILQEGGLIDIVG